MIHDSLYLFLNIAGKKEEFPSFPPFASLLVDCGFKFLGRGERQTNEQNKPARRRNIFDGIVLIKILFKLHAFEKTVESGKWRAKRE